MRKPLKKPIRWVSSSKKDLKGFPAEVQDTVGRALRDAQYGGKPLNAKPLKGFHGAGVLEVIEDHDGNTYRAVYTVKFAGWVYVLHAFQKKSSKRVATPRKEMDVVRARFAIAERHHHQGEDP